MKLTLTYVNLKQQISTKTGKPYTSQSIKSTEYGDRFLSGFGSKETASWKVGDVVEVEVKDSDKMDKTGKPYLNWSLNKPTSPVMDKIAALEFSVANLHRKIAEIVTEVKRLNPASQLTSAGTKVPDFTPNTLQEAETFASQMHDYEEANGLLNMVAEEEIR